MSDLARQVVSGFGPQWVIAEVAKLYPNDITRVRVNVRGQRADAILGNPQWVLHEGDWVICLGPHSVSRQYLIVGYTGSVNPGLWFEAGGEVPDLTAGNGPVPGFRPPVDSDSLWRDLGGRDTPETQYGHHLTPRPIPDDTPGRGRIIRVYAGHTDDPVDSYGNLTVIGDRLQIERDVGAILKPRAYCLTTSTPAEYGPAVTYKAGTMLNMRPFGPNEPDPEMIGGGLCDPTQTDKTMLEFGPILNPAKGWTVRIDFLLDKNEDAWILYAKHAPALADVYFSIAYSPTYGYAVGVGREIIAGHGGVGNGGWMSPASATSVPQTGNWAPCIPWKVGGTNAVYDRWGGLIGYDVFGWNRIEVTYSPGVYTEAYGFVSGLEVSNGGTLGHDAKSENYSIDGEVFNGQDVSLYTYAGNMDGSLISPRTKPLRIASGETDNKYPLRAPRRPRALRMMAGEIGYHMQLLPGDTDENGNELIRDPGDSLLDGLYVQTRPDRLMWIPGYVLEVDPTTGFVVPDVAGNDTPEHKRYFAHDKLTELEDDDHPQYLTEARALTWLGTRTTGDLPAGEGVEYITDEDRAILDQLADEPTGLAGGVPPINLTSQVTGSINTFTTPARFVAGTLRVTLNSTPLRNGIDFVEKPDRQGFQITLRTPTATSPADVLRVGYRVES